MSLTIVIPCYNKSNFTRSILEDLSYLDVKTHEIIVVNNASTDNTLELISVFNRENIKIINSPINGGFAYACNLGYAAAAKENIMFLNNDVRVKQMHNMWTTEIIANASKAIVGPTMGLIDDSFAFIKEENVLINKRLSYMSGWCITASKEIWQKVEFAPGKLFWTDTFAYFEDTYLSFVAKEKQIPFKVVKVPLIHFGKQTSSLIGIQELYLSAKEKFTNVWKDRAKKIPKMVVV